ncbi:hypothetical protein [Sphingomonas sp. CV7422]|nr:hypothetical protein [Sphingomonas sp. CV7422]
MQTEAIFDQPLGQFGEQQHDDQDADHVEQRARRFDTLPRQ